jgi:hypothetical protein
MSAADRWTDQEMNTYVRAGTVPATAVTRPATATPAKTRRGKQGAPRDLTGLSTGNPFARCSELAGPYDATMAGYTDLRRNLPPSHEMAVPHRVSVWPEK